MKKLIKRPTNTLAVFEAATKASPLDIEITNARFRDKTMFIQKLTGIVHQGRKNILVYWNSKGQARVHNIRTPEFDLTLLAS